MALKAVGEAAAIKSKTGVSAFTNELFNFVVQNNRGQAQIKQAQIKKDEPKVDQKKIAKNIQNAEKKGHIKTITITDFEKDVITASKKAPVIVDVSTSWCIPCRTLTPILEEHVAAQKGRVRLVKLDVVMDEKTGKITSADEKATRELFIDPTEPQRPPSMGFPTVLIYKDGKRTHSLSSMELKTFAELAREQEKMVQAYLARKKAQEEQAKLGVPPTPSAKPPQKPPVLSAEEQEKKRQEYEGRVHARVQEIINNLIDKK